MNKGQSAIKNVLSRHATWHHQAADRLGWAVRVARLLPRHVWGGMVRTLETSPNAFAVLDPAVWQRLKL